jgi:energy-coupling factor transport system permease/ATP-binding protein
LAPGVLGVLSVAFSNWVLSPGHDVAAAATAGLRVAFFVVPGVLLASRVDPFVLGDHLGQRLRLPARPVVAAVAALQRFEGLDQQWHQLRRTRRVRGLDVGRSPLARARQLGALTAGLLVQSLRQAGRMAVAMEARGFSTPRAQGRRRTWAEPAPWRRADCLMVALGLAVAAVPALLWSVR